mgnify:CR=1 FL=1
MSLSDGESLERIRKEFWKHSLNFPRKYARIKNIINSTGDDLEQVRNCKYAFSTTEAENVNYSFFSASGAKDCFDVDHVALGSSEAYELHSSFGSNKAFFSSRIYDSHNVSYSDDVYNSENIFACAGLRKKSNCIFNKEYTKEEYEIPTEKIKKHMNEMPYIDKKGRVFSYGEFFPIDIMPFSYNDAVVHEYFPLTREEILEKGYKYKEPEVKNYKPTILPHQLPPIEKTDEKVLQEIIQCEHMRSCNDRCTMAFRIIQNELNICKMLDVPLPKLCPNCRHMSRMSLLNPLKLYHRKCMKKGCDNEFETSYAPERPEIVYCERCYQQEVY